MQHQPRLQPRVDAALRPGQDLEGQRLQRVTGQNRRRLVPLDVHRRLAAADRVVVHARQVVVHQAVGVDALDRRRRAKRLRRRHPEDRGSLHRDEGAQPLAAREHRVPHREPEGRVAGGQQALERRLDPRRRLAQDRVELQDRLIHRVRGSRPVAP